MNRRADSVALLTVPGEELIPGGFQPRDRGYTIAAREVLFGFRPDRHMLNYRCRQYLAVLHALELDSYLTDLDSRISYDFADNPFLDEALFRPFYVPTSTTEAQLFLEGELGPPDTNGRMRRVWHVTVTSDSTVRIRQDSGPLQTLAAYTVENNLSSAVTLPGSGLRIRFRPVVGASWRIEGLSRPTTDLTAIEAATHQLSAGVTEPLFRDPEPDAAAVEPWDTFRNLWEQHPEMPYRLAGFLLALIYQADRIPPHE